MVHEDDDILIIDKPAGLLTANLPGEHRESAFDAVKEYVRGRRRRPVQVWIIHRLDKEVSGLLVFAKSERAFHWLKEDFRSRRAHRLYTAVVEGEVRGGDGDGPSSAGPLAGTIQSYLIEEDSGEIRSVELGGLASAGFDSRGSRDRRGTDRRAAGTGKSGAGEPRLAVTHWRVVHAGLGRTLVQLRLETGRKNQIRVHMRQWGHPICGDRRFGAATDPLGRVALHAGELGFAHPTTGQSLRYSSPLPAAFNRLVGRHPPPSLPRGPEGSTPSPTMVKGPGHDAAPTGAPPHVEAAHPGVGGAAGANSKLAEPAQEPTPEHTAPPIPPPVMAARPRAATSWDHVAQWYDKLIDEQRSDLYHAVIAPGTLRMLVPTTGMRVLDVACGQGDMCRRLAERGVHTVGLDAAPRLIEAARSRPLAAGVPSPVYIVGDARAIPDQGRELPAGSFDAAICVMALMNINPLEPLMRGVAGVLKPGGAFVCVILHPAFRAPGQTSWGWDKAGEGPRRPRPDERGREGNRAQSRVRQYRRVDGYLSPGQSPIVMNPGATARGAPAVTTLTFHRPIQAYVRAMTDAGLLIAALEEWPSPRVSQPGPRAAEENRARGEIPMFLAIRGVRAEASGRRA